MANLNITTNANVKVAQDANAPVSMVTGWDKVFKENTQVAHQKVTFKNRYGISIVADLYYPKNLDPQQKHQAIAVSGPFGAIKEQSSGEYAQELASQGFVTLAFDPSYTGESGGFPRGNTSPDLNVEDFSAAVDFLSNQSFVDPNKIGILGICGWGGVALSEAQVDTRVKAVATVVMYDMSRAIGYGVGDGQDAYSTSDRRVIKNYMADLRTQDFKAGYANPSYNTYNYMVNGDKVDIYPALWQLDQNSALPPVVAEFSEYYQTPRGYHERSVNSHGLWQATIGLKYFNFNNLDHTDEIQIPTLIITGEIAHSRYFAETAYQKVGSSNKELVIVPGANHVDLYDNVKGVAPFAKLGQFFTTNLNK
ncbi:hypothetical protein CKF59_05415 [Psittacicella gerlachiana]|uniref:Dienelactone hydrolase domain-containing protein n=2 Tax=Psittacicella gerlachiana TaxID=2028574 RepID=A0A3A1YBD3_9GAMM|nr:hypothetical protein CKF59_05415 [Psittacicella gerlachiana]